MARDRQSEDCGMGSFFCGPDWRLRLVGREKLLAPNEMYLFRHAPDGHSSLGAATHLVHWDLDRKPQTLVVVHLVVD